MSFIISPGLLNIRRRLTYALPEEESFYSKKENIAALKFIETSMVSRYFKAEYVEECKKTVEAFWDNVGKGIVTPQKCEEITKKCNFLLRKILGDFSQTAKTKGRFAVVNIEHAQKRLYYVAANSIAETYFQLNDSDVSLLDYFVLRCHTLSTVFIKHLLRLHVKLTIGEIESAELQGEKNLPKLPILSEHLKSSTPIESLIETEWVLGPTNPRHFNLIYPAFDGMKLGDRESTLQKSANAWKKLDP